MNVARAFSILSWAVLLSAAGCRSARETTAVAGGGGSVIARPVDPNTVGTLTGSVLFKGKAPERVRIDMSMDPACSLRGGENLSEPFVIAKGMLANVYVYLKNAPASSAPSNTPVVLLDQKGCRFNPHVIAIQQGSAVEFRNSDPTMHNIHTTPASAESKSVDVSQGPFGQPETERFNKPETMLPIRCNNHPWMNGFLNVAPSPYFAISAADGSFIIRNVPPGTYTLAAVHEKLGEQDVQITVAAKETQKTDIAFASGGSR